MLKSDANGTASLITHGTISGLSKSERFLDNINAFGYTIATPVQDALHDIFTGHINTYFYNPLTPGWEAINMSAGSLQIMRGYFTKFDDDKTIEFSDVFNTGDISFTDLYRIAPYGSGNMGWNFLGNPYPSAIDWKEVETLNINGGTGLKPFTDSTKLNYAVYISDNNGAYFSYVNGIGQTGFDDGIIPANAAFWVQVNKDYHDPNNTHLPIAGAKLHLNNTVRVHENLATGAKSNSIGIIRLFNQRENQKDEIIVRLLNDASLDFDPAFDAFKMFADGQDVPQFYMTLPNNDKLSINSLPENMALPHLIPLGVKSMANEAHKIYIDLSAFDYNLIDVHLEDKVTGTFTDMRLHNSYTYNTLGNDENQRFVLHLGALTNIEEEKPFSKLNIYAHHNNIYVTGLNEGVDFCLFNLLGQEIQHNSLEQGSHIISVDVIKGTYIVQITGNHKTENQKVYIY